MFTVVRYSVIRSPSTTALIETTSAPLIPRSVLPASCTALAAASANPSGDDPMIVTTFATSAISAPFVESERDLNRTTPPVHLAADVRHPVGEAPGDARRSARPRPPRRGGDLARDARDPARAARGRRQLQGRERLRRPRARAGARSGRGEEPDARPAGREDRPRGADGADGRGQLEARLRRPAADGDPPRRAPGLGQDDRRGEARAAPAQGGQEAGDGRRRPPAPGRYRPARAARPSDPDPGLRRGAQRPGR